MLKFVYVDLVIYVELLIFKIIWFQCFLFFFNTIIFSKFYKIISVWWFGNLSWTFLTDSLKAFSELLYRLYK